MTPLPYEVLVDYWLGDLSPEREAAVEEQLFVDEESARRLEAVARLDRTVCEVVRRGRVQATVTVETLAQLERAGASLRTYPIEPGQTVPCGVASEDYVAVRLRGPFEGLEAVDLHVEIVPEGEDPVETKQPAIPVDAGSGEVVMLFPGAMIRPLPSTRIRYRVRNADGDDLGEYRLEHSPSRT